MCSEAFGRMWHPGKSCAGGIVFADTYNFPESAPGSILTDTYNFPRSILTDSYNFPRISVLQPAWRSGFQRDLVERVGV
jgi:hypothetical protein